MNEPSSNVQNVIATILQTYDPSEQTKNIVRQTPLMLLVGISGAGKDTMCKKLVKSNAYHLLVTTTTRQPRQNQGTLEKNGIDYHFITLAEALLKLQNGEYIEGNIYSGNMYGTTVSEMAKALSSGKIAITDIDVNGVANYKKISHNVIAAFVVPPNFEEWQRRLASRYGDTGPDPVDMQKRMNTAIDELEHALGEEYYHFIVNDNLDYAVHATNSIAHNHDKFNEIDQEVRGQAETLLADLRAHVA